jgi:four helix bundle protein
METAMEIFHLTKTFRKRKILLVDQIRRSSRSVCTNLAEGGVSDDIKLPYCQIEMQKVRRVKRKYGLRLLGDVNI